MGLERWEGRKRGTRELLMVMVMFTVLTVVMVSGVYAYVKTYQIIL